jgi:tRNA 2-thiouridine synthesizing protein E
MDKVLAGKTVAVNEEGFMTDPAQWSPEVAKAIAAEEGIDMTERHWQIVKYLQEQYKQEIPMSIRKVKNSGVIDLKEFYALFPKGPLKIASKIAGLPKPTSCI